jgi:hypothetical protein
MAAVPRPSARTTWLSVNVPRMIVLVRALGVDDGKAVTAHNRPEAAIAESHQPQHDVVNRSL